MFRRCKRHARTLLKTTATAPRTGLPDKIATSASQASNCFDSTGVVRASGRSFANNSNYSQPFSPLASHSLYQDLRPRRDVSEAALQIAQFATSADPPGPDRPDQASTPQNANPSAAEPLSQGQSLPAVLQDEHDTDVEARQGPRQMLLKEHVAVLKRLNELLQEGKVDEIVDLIKYAFRRYNPEEILTMVSFSKIACITIACTLHKAGLHGVAAASRDWINQQGTICLHLILSCRDMPGACACTWPATGSRWAMQAFLPQPKCKCIPCIPPGLMLPLNNASSDRLGPIDNHAGYTHEPWLPTCINLVSFSGLVALDMRLLIRLACRIIDASHMCNSV